MKQSHQDKQSTSHYNFELNSLPDIVNSNNGGDDECVKCKKVSISYNNNATNQTQTQYYLINYDKKMMRTSLKTEKNKSESDKRCIKHFRSVVLNEDCKVIGFSPPMCESKDVVLDIQNIQFAEEFVEGTMVNLFYNSANDVQSWEFSTKNTISPLEKPAGKCFRRMFFETCANANLNFDDLPKEYCYSFVMQHPDNVIVAPVKTTALYIIAIYLVKNGDDFSSATAYEMERSVLKWSSFSNVSHPARLGMKKGQGDFDKIVKTYASPDSLYYYPGVMFRTFTGERFKLRNPNYEMVKNTKGVRARDEFVYLHLKQMGYVRKHFERCPEDELKFFEFQSNLYNYTSSLHKNYLDCYIYKKMGLKDFPLKYRNNMYKLHNDYLHVLKPEGARVTLSHVVQFVNNLSVSSQIYFLKQKESTEPVEPVEHVEPLETPIVPKKIFSSPPLTPLTFTPEYSPLEMKCPNAP
jgi:hypothetical protein